MPLATPPRSALGAEKSVLLVPHRPTLAPGRPTVVIADKIKCIHFQKVSKNLFLPTISVLPLMQQVFRAVSTSCDVGRVLAGHPWRVRVVTATIRQGYTLQFPRRPPRCACHHSVQRGLTSPLRRGDGSAGKRSHRNHSSSQKLVRLLQSLLPRPPKKDGGLQPIFTLLYF